MPFRMPSLRLALYQPDMPPNTGAMMRLCACLGVAMDIIGPCGFPLDDARLRRAAMDYFDHLDLTKHKSWEAFLEQTGKRRLVLLTTKADKPYTDLAYRGDDILVVGRESAGVPEEVRKRADERVFIPMKEGMRSLNVAISAGMVLGEALRQKSLQK